MKKKYKNEIWKPLKDYEGLYLISNYGRIKSLTYNRIRVNTLSKNGYLRLRLSKKGKVKTITVHTLVAKNFIPQENLLKNQVNHINGIKTDNRVENLQWVTAQENITHAIKKGLSDPRNGRKEIIIEYEKINDKKYALESDIKLSKKYNLSPTVIGKRRKEQGILYKNQKTKGVK
jgi:hypothetical protein